MDCVNICGVPFLLQGEASPAHAAIAEMFRCLPRQNAAPGVTLCVRQLEQETSLNRYLPAWLLAHVVNLPESDEVQLVYGDTGNCAALAANELTRYCAWMDAGTQHLHYLAQKRTAGLTPLSVSSVLVPVLREFFAVQDKVLLHAAALQTPSGHGVLLLAESGGGKTTTALSLLRSGARLLADDLVTLQTVDNTTHMQGIAEALNLSAQTIAFFPELENAVRALPTQTVLPNGKRVLAADAVYGQAYTHEPCPLHAICVLQIDRDKPLLQPLSVQHAFGLLLHAHTFARGQRPSHAAMAVCSSALETLPAYTLFSGPNPQALGPWLMDALQNLHPLKKVC
ncbi:MAG: hypothetical protein GX087_08685 [Desulfobulbaceae bacterium]|nr:hypothetical protein [Desulfobulbaceae bacterium]